jgi:hypothetical protein
LGDGIVQNVTYFVSENWNTFPVLNTLPACISMWKQGQRCSLGRFSACVCVNNEDLTPVSSKKEHWEEQHWRRLYSVTPCSLGDDYWRFNGKYCLILKMDEG